MKKFLIIGLIITISPNAFAYCSNIGERESGMNKICYYDCMSGEAAITIDSYKICPISINDPKRGY